MMLRSCPNEKEMRELLIRGQWPHAAETTPELYAHVAACRSCSELVLVAESFRNARAASAASARMIPPGVLWWRAQLRRRNAAVERVTRTLFGAQVFALAITLLTGVGFLVFEGLTSDACRAWLKQLPQNAALDWHNLLAATAANPAWTWMMLGPALVLLGGVALYMATDRQ
jgi:predicted anti-sigma-YlaC factor YlaD